MTKPPPQPDAPRVAAAPEPNDGAARPPAAVPTTGGRPVATSARFTDWAAI